MRMPIEAGGQNGRGMPGRDHNQIGQPQTQEQNNHMQPNHIAEQLNQYSINELNNDPFYISWGDQLPITKQPNTI